jgi:hypothetical protein
MRPGVNDDGVFVQERKAGDREWRQRIEVETENEQSRERQDSKSSSGYNC